MSTSKLTPSDIQDKIFKDYYYVFPGTTLTVCCLLLENGYTAIGQSASVNPEDFDEEMGRSIAYQKAFQKVWDLEAYLLKERLYESEPTNSA